MLDGDVLRDHGLQWTLIQTEEISRTMFIGVFGDVGEICMINSILRKHNYHQITQTGALLSGKKLCGRLFMNTFLTCVNCIYLKKMRKPR